MVTWVALPRPKRWDRLIKFKHFVNTIWPFQGQWCKIGYISKCSGPYWSNPPLLIFWRLRTLALRTERQTTQCHSALRFDWLIFVTIRITVRLRGLTDLHQITTSWKTAICVSPVTYVSAEPDFSGQLRLKSFIIKHVQVFDVKILSLLGQVSSQHRQVTRRL